MNPALTDTELIRAASGTASPLVRILAARIADRGAEAEAVREMLATVRHLIGAGQLSEALDLIDKARAALDWRWSIPHYPPAEGDPLKKD